MPYPVVMTRRHLGAGALIVGALLVAGSMSIPHASTTPAPSRTATVAASTVPAPSVVPVTPTDRLADFEKANTISFPEVTNREIRLGALWVYTTLGHAGKDRAGAICGAYAQYSLVDPGVGVVFVRAADGLQLAKCGPKA